jgi:hypothetical protein
LDRKVKDIRVYPLDLFKKREIITKNLFLYLTKPRFMLKELCSAIQQGHPFDTGKIPGETITSTSHLPQHEAEKEAVMIARKGSHLSVKVQFKDRKTTGSVRLINAEITGIDSSHPQFVRRVNGSEYAIVRSERAI